MPYTPAKNVFNGSTLSFDGHDVAAITDIEWHVGGQKVDIASALDDSMLYGQGLDDPEISITVVGGPTLARGDTGALSVSFNADDNPSDLGEALVNDMVTSGSKNGAITTKYQFVPAPASDS